MVRQEIANLSRCKKPLVGSNPALSAFARRSPAKSGTKAGFCPHSLMDKVQLCGSCDEGSTPSGGTWTVSSMAEHRVYIAEVIGSNPIPSTIKNWKRIAGVAHW